MFYFKALSTYSTFKKCLQQVCSYFSKSREYKIKGCTLCSPELFYVCVKDCSG